MEEVHRMVSTHRLVDEAMLRKSSSQLMVDLARTDEAAEKSERVEMQVPTACLPKHDQIRPLSTPQQSVRICPNRLSVLRLACD